MCLGLLALKKLRVNQIPDVQQPVIVVTIPYPGASPETVEREIINRIEKALQSIPQVYEIRSHRRREQRADRHHLQLQEEHVEASDEIRNAIASVRYKLPVEMREPILQRLDPSAQPIMQLALSSTTQSHARDLAPRRGRARRPLPRHRRRGGGERQRARSSASSRCCCMPRSCASSTSR